MIETALARLGAGDPLALVAAGGTLVLALIVALLWVSVSRAGRSARTTEDLARHLGRLGSDVQGLSQGQTQLSGSLQTVSETAAQSQMHVLQTVEKRLAEVQRQMGERLADSQLKQARGMSDMQERLNEVLSGQAQKTATSLTQLQQRLAAIDKAQDNITKLSGDVLCLQDIL